MMNQQVSHVATVCPVDPVTAIRWQQPRQTLRLCRRKLAFSSLARCLALAVLTPAVTLTSGDDVYESKVCRICSWCFGAADTCYDAI